MSRQWHSEDDYRTLERAHEALRKEYNVQVHANCEQSLVHQETLEGLQVELSAARRDEAYWTKRAKQVGRAVERYVELYGALPAEESK